MRGDTIRTLVLQRVSTAHLYRPIWHPFLTLYQTIVSKKLEEQRKSSFFPWIDTLPGLSTGDSEVVFDLFQLWTPPQRAWGKLWPTSCFPSPSCVLCHLSSWLSYVLCTVSLCHLSSWYSSTCLSMPLLPSTLYVYLPHPSFMFSYLPHPSVCVQGQLNVVNLMLLPPQ